MNNLLEKKTLSRLYLNYRARITAGYFLLAPSCSVLRGWKRAPLIALHWLLTAGKHHFLGVLLRKKAQQKLSCSFTESVVPCVTSDGTPAFSVSFIWKWLCGAGRMFQLLQVRQVTFSTLCMPTWTGRKKEKVDDEALLICKTLNLCAIIIYSASSRSALPVSALTEQQTHAGDHRRTIASCNWIKM